MKRKRKIEHTFWAIALITGLVMLTVMIYTVCKTNAFSPMELKKQGYKEWVQKGE